MKEVKTLNDLRKEFRGIKSYVSGDTIWMAKATLYLIERFEEFLSRPVAEPKPKRAPTEWQKFFGSAMKNGLSAAEAAEEWNSREKRE